jgi:hypothetical protein
MAIRTDCGIYKDDGMTLAFSAGMYICRNSIAFCSGVSSPAKKYCPPISLFFSIDVYVNIKPQSVLIAILIVIYYFLLIIRLFVNVNCPVSPSLVEAVNTKYILKFDKAETRLGYKPLYDYLYSLIHLYIIYYRTCDNNQTIDRSLHGDTSTHS